MAEFVPSLRFHFLTPYYDLLFRILLPEKQLRQILIDLIDKAKSNEIVELGCSTGGLTLAIAKQFPDSTIHAVDIDQCALGLLKEKIKDSQFKQITLTHASSFALPFNNNTENIVVASLLFCNLTSENKQKSLFEIKRILRNGGQLVIMDWGAPMTTLSAMGFYILQTIGGRRTTNDLKKGILDELLKTSGFTVCEKTCKNTLFGTLYFYATIVEKETII